MAEGLPRLMLSLDGFEGPLDLLLDLARSQKVDLARISILSLVEQYLAIVEGAKGEGVRLEVAGDWLVMAAWLAWLKSRLLLPAGLEAADEGAEAAGLLTARLDELERMQAAARRLAERAQLGRDVFARGAPERLAAAGRSGLAADLAGLARGYMAVRRRGGGRERYRPQRLAVWTVADALGRLERMLGRISGWVAFERFLPEAAGAGAVQRRAAVASTLLAGLELARGGAADLRQAEAFGPIAVRGVHGAG